MKEHFVNVTMKMHVNDEVKACFIAWLRRWKNAFVTVKNKSDFAGMIRDVENNDPEYWYEKTKTHFGIFACHYGGYRYQSENCVFDWTIGKSNFKVLPTDGFVGRK